MPETQRKRIHVWVGGLICIGLIMAAVLSKPATSRTYKGRGLEYWFQELQAKEPALRNEAESAFATLGKDCLPFLMAQLTSDIPTDGQRAKAWFREVVLRKPRPIGVCGLGLASEQAARRERLTRAFALVGAQGEPFVGKLGSLVGSPYCSHDAAGCLAAMGSLGWPELLRAARSANVESRRTIASVIAETKANRAQAARLLTTMIGDPDGLVRHYAAHSLGTLGEMPEDSVRALTIALGDADARVRYISLFALKRFGAAAVSALPKIQKLEEDSEENIRKSAVEIGDELALIASVRKP